MQKYINERVTAATTILKIYFIISKCKIKSNIFLTASWKSQKFKHLSLILVCSMADDALTSRICQVSISCSK